MNICGCGQEMSCFKTGLRLHDNNYYPASVFAADAFFCRACLSIYIHRNDCEYLCDQGPAVDLVIDHDPDNIAMQWNPDFAAKIFTQYNLDLLKGATHENDHCSDEESLEAGRQGSDHAVEPQGAPAVGSSSKEAVTTR